MPTLFAYSYAILRVVPHVEREEFVNAGAIVFCDDREYLAAAVDLDVARLTALAPVVDGALVSRHLDAVARICAGGVAAGPIGALARRERWRWLVAPRSTIVQTSPAHGGICAAPEQELERLMREMVRRPALARRPAGAP